MIRKVFSSDLLNAACSRTGSTEAVEAKEHPNSDHT